MLNSAHDDPGHDELETVVRRGPGGAIAVAGIATAVVVAIWLGFYLFVFLPQSAP